MKDALRGAGAWVAGCALVGLMLAGCAAGPNYRRPAIDAPAAFRGAGTETNSLGDQAWWEVFHDPALQQLIHVALTNNYDARIAAARLEQAHAIWAENRSLFWPQVNYQAGVGRGKNVQGNMPSSTGGKTGTGILADANVSWEIDFFGRIRRLNESARAQFLATDEARRDVMAMLVSDVAQAYFQLLALDQELRIARDSTNSFGQSLKIFGERFRGGVASKLEVASAEALMAAAAASALEVERQITAQENFLSLLLGVNPGPIARGSVLLPEALPPDVPPGLPSALLERRPDIRQAEENLRSANALVGVAKADFFPRFTLTGLLGQTSSELAGFFGSANQAWEIAAGVTGPIFEGGLLRAQYRAARAVWDEARLQYQQTILTAFREVADALAGARKTGGGTDRADASGGGLPGSGEAFDGALHAGTGELLRSAAGAAVAFPGGEHADANPAKPGAGGGAVISRAGRRVDGALEIVYLFDWRIIGGGQEGGVNFFDDFAIGFGGGLNGFPGGVFHEFLPGVVAGGAAGIGEDVNEFIFVLAVLADGDPEGDDFHAVTLEKLDGVIAEAGVQGLEFAGGGVVGAHFETARVEGEGGRDGRGLGRGGEGREGQDEEQEELSHKNGG